MAAVGRRVDQPRAPVAPPQHVPAPQVAVQARGRLGRPGELGDARADALDRPVAEAREPRVRQERQQPPLGVERRPVGRGVVGERSDARARRARSAPRRRAAAPRLAGRRRRPKSSAPAAWTSARPAPNAAGVAAARPRRPSRARAPRSPTPSTSGTRSAPGSPSQRSAGRLGRVLAGRDVRAGLDERRRTRRRTARGRRR